MVRLRNYFWLGFFCLFTVSLSGQVANNMTLIGRWDNDNLPASSGIAFNDIWGWADTVKNREYAIMGSLEYTYFIEVTDPANPIVRDSVAGRHNNCIHRDYKTYGNICYAVADEGPSSFQVIDMQYLPDSVHLLIDTQNDFRRAHNVYVDLDSALLYVVGPNTRSNGAIVYDLRNNPANPSLVFNQGLGQYCHDVFVRNDTAWMSNGFSGLTVYDFDNPASPVQIGALSNYVFQGYNHSSWLTDDGNYLVMADETWDMPLKILDVSDPGNMSVVSTFKSTLLAPADTTSIPHNPIIYGNYALVSYYHDGLQLFDIRDPNNPVQIAGYDTDTISTNYNGYKGCWGVYPFLPSGNVLASDVAGGLFVLRPNFAFPYDMANQSTQNDVSCPNGNDGQISLNPSGGTAPYSYLWSHGDTNALAQNLSVGNYTVTISDRYGYTFLDTFSLSGPPAFSLSPGVSGETCAGTGNGSITVSVGGGTPGYSYLWSNGATVPNPGGLGAGSYYLTVTDANGCNYLDSVTVPLLNPAPLAFAGNDTLSCNIDMQLNAAPANVGTGFWTLLNGSGNFAYPILHNTQVVGLNPFGNNQFVWTVTAGPCTDADTVSVRVASTAMIDAGWDIQLCDQNTAMLSGSSPNPGSGQWASSSSGLSIASPSSATTMLAQIPFGSSVLTWTVTDGICSAADSIVVERFQTPVAFAGLDTLSCAADLQLDATAPSVGVGSWSVLNGGAIFANSSSHNTNVSGLNPSGLNEFEWEVSNGPCGDRDTVSIRVAASYLADAGPDRLLCDLDALITLASDPSPGTGLWASSDPGISFSSVSIPNSTVNQIPLGTSFLYWSVTDGHCVRTDSLQIDRILSPVAGFSSLANELVVDFSDTSGGSQLQSWQWDFGDGNTSTQQNPSHTYANSGTYQACLIVSNACGSDTSCQSIQVVTTGISNPIRTFVKLWPNPARDVLQWEVLPGAGKAVAIRVYSLRGKLLQSHEISTARGAVQLGELAEGMYFIVLQTSDAQIRERLLILD